MTNQEIVRAFTLELDKLDSYSLPELKIDQKLYFLNKALTRVTDKKYNGLNKSGKGFEESEFKRSELKKLVKISTALTSTSTNVNYNSSIKYNTYTFPNDYNYYLRNSIKYKYLKRSCNELSGFLTSYFNFKDIDDIDKALNDPFNKPVKSSTIAVVEDNKLKIYYDSTSQLGDITLTYLKIPTRIDNTTNPYPDLEDKTLYEVISEAVNEVLETVESNRVQTHQIEMNKIE